MKRILPVALVVAILLSFAVTAAASPPTSFTVTFYALDETTVVCSQTVVAAGKIEGGDPALYNSWCTAAAMALNYKVPAGATVVPGMLRDIDTGAIFIWKTTPIVKNMKVTLPLESVAPPVIAKHLVTFYALDEVTVVCTQYVNDGAFIEGGDPALYNSWSSAAALAMIWKLPAGKAAVSNTLRELATGIEFNWKSTPITKDMDVTLAVLTTHYKVTFYAADESTVVYTMMVPIGSAINPNDAGLKATWSTNAIMYATYQIPSTWTVKPHYLLDLDTGAEFPYMTTPITKDTKVGLVYDKGWLVKFYALDETTLICQQYVPKNGFINGGDPALYNSWSSPAALAANWQLPADWEAVPYTLRELGTANEFNWQTTPMTKDISVTIAVIKPLLVRFFALDETTLVVQQYVKPGQFIEGGDPALYNSWSTPSALNANYGIDPGLWDAVPNMLREVGTANEFNWRTTPITRDIDVTIAVIPHVFRWITIVIPPDCETGGYSYKADEDTGILHPDGPFDFTAPLGHLYNESKAIKDHIGWYALCERCSISFYLRYEDGTLIDPNDDLVPIILDAEITPTAFASATVTNGMYGTFVVTFNITEYYKHNTPPQADISYTINVPNNFTGSIDVGRYVINYTINSGVLSQLEIGAINYYGHG